MKRIDAITRGKGLISEVLNRRSARVMRQLDQAIDAAKDAAQDHRDAAELIINSFGEAADGSQTDMLCKKFNRYIDEMSDVEVAENTAKILTELKKKLNEDVKVESE